MSLKRGDRFCFRSPAGSKYVGKEPVWVIHNIMADPHSSQLLYYMVSMEESKWMCEGWLNANYSKLPIHIVSMRNN